MPQYPGNFPGDPGSRPPLPPPLAPPVQPFPPPQGQGQGLGSKKGKNKDNMDAKGQRAIQNNPNIVNERCTAHNFSGRGCIFGQNCLRLHICFNCGDPSHRAPQCPYPRQYKRMY